MKYFNAIIILSLIYINFGREYVPSIINKKKDFINGILIGILSFKLFGITIEGNTGDGIDVECNRGCVGIGDINAGKATQDSDYCISNSEGNNSTNTTCPIGCTCVHSPDNKNIIWKYRGKKEI